MTRVVAVIGVVVVGLAVALLAAVSALAGMGGGTGSAPSGAARADIPSTLLNLYLTAAADCPGLDWAVLAAIGKIESDHGRSTLSGVAAGSVNAAGAGGIMQFLQPTFESVTRAHPLPPGGASPPSRYNAHDAVHAAAFYLCDSGARAGDLRAALFTYNRSTTYVDNVLHQADLYRDSTPRPGGTGTPGLVALAWARAQIGTPYVWGGDGPAEGGFDCSGLTTAAYDAAGITLPRTAHTQYLAAPLLPPGTPLAPGDLLFFGTPNRVHHVGIALGQGLLMINAPHTGATVRLDDAARYPDLLAASRPASTAIQIPAGNTPPAPINPAQDDVTVPGRSRPAGPTDRPDDGGSSSSSD